METDNRKGRASRLSAAFKTGAFALVFLVLGYQTALLVFKASVSAVVAHRDRPDTVFVVDRELAKELLSVEGLAGQVGHDAPSSLDPLAPPSTTVIRRAASHSPQAQAIVRNYTPRRIENFRFDPNRISVPDLERLGFSEKQALAIDKYRKVGGRFRRKEDFARSFVVADSVYRRLEPYIDIPLIDLNRADSAAFDSLPGIGPYYASRMVSYRAELGGYSYPEQLMDIWKFDRERFDALKDLITISQPYRYPLWRLGEDSLKLHPYIRSYAAHGIVLFRENTPRGEWTVDNLAAAGILKGEMAAKLARCVE